MKTLPANIRQLNEADINQFCGQPLMIVPMATPTSKAPSNADGYLLACALQKNKTLKAIHKTRSQVEFIENNFIELWTFVAVITDKDGGKYGLMTLEDVRLKDAC